MIEEYMKKDVGKTFDWNGQRIQIVHSFGCYDGDFYEYTVNGGTETHRINIWTTEGRSFCNCIPQEDKT